MLTVEENPRAWHNPDHRFDVDASGLAGDPFPLDVLLVINFLNAHGNTRLPQPPSPLGPPPYLDVTGDGWVTPHDVLEIINVINAQTAGEGEAEPTFLALSHGDQPGRPVPAMAGQDAVTTSANEHVGIGCRPNLRHFADVRGIDGS